MNDEIHLFDVSHEILKQIEAGDDLIIKSWFLRKYKFFKVQQQKMQFLQQVIKLMK